MWVVREESSNINTDEPFVPVDDAIPVAVAQDATDNTIWILHCRVSRHIDAILREK